MSFYTPKEIIPIVNELAKSKAKLSNTKTFVLAILGGAYIAMGALLAIVIGGGIPEIAAANPGLQKLLFAAFFPLGLLLIAIAGGELFTGNTAYFIPSLLKGKTTLKTIFKNWGIVFLGNFLGAILFALLFAYYTEILKTDPWLTATKNIGLAKVASPFHVALLKGIACNWLVALAMWLSFAAKSIPGKILGIWFPIMAFVAMGLEHSIANMFFIPTAIFYGTEISWTAFFLHNLLPVTIGNIIGGALFVGGLYGYLYTEEK